VPTWEVFQRRFTLDSKWCVLCNISRETNDHLFIHHSFTRRVWDSCKNTLVLSFQQDAPDFPYSWKVCMKDQHAKGIHALSIILYWGIWIVQNKSIFAGVSSYPNHVIVKGLAILSHFSKGLVVTHVQNMAHAEPDQTCPLRFFDRAPQGDSPMCGGGFVLYISSQHFYHVQLSFGWGSNNWAKINAC